MDELKKKYRKMLKKKKFLKIGYFFLIGVSLLAGLTGVIISGVTNQYRFLSMYMILFLVVPIVLWVCFLVFLVANKDKKRKNLDLELVNSDLDAEEIMQIGKELNINLFDVALRKRAKELGMDIIPEWCVRNGVLPTKDNI